MKKLLLFAVCLFAFATLFAQKEFRGFFGLGAGLDYGGFGIKTEFMPVKNVGIFGGVGYNLADLGYNVGASCKFLTEKRIQPFITAMYGYNGVIKLQSFNGYVDKKISYGVSAGVGCDFYNQNGRNKFTLELLVPFRSGEFTDYYNRLKDAGYKFQNNLLPVTFSIGYNFALSKMK